MRAREAAVLLFITVLTCLHPSPAGSASADITRYVPASAPAVLVVKDAGGLFERLQAFGATAPEDKAPARVDGLAGILALLGIAHVPEGLDEKGEILVAVPQFPFPLVAVAVTDYDLFLKSLASPLPPGAAAPSSPLPGIDMVTVGGKPLFARKDGQFALLSSAPMLLTPPAEEASLSKVLSDDEREVMAGKDAFLRLDIGILLAFAEPFIQQGLAGLGAETTDAPVKPDPPAGPGPPVNPDAPAVKGEYAARLLAAEVGLILNGMRQVRSFSIGAKVDGEAIGISSAYLALPDSGFEAMLRENTPGRPSGFLRYFDGDAAMAGSVHINREILETITATMTEFLFASGVYNLSDSDRQDWEKLLKAGLEIAGSNSAYYFGPSASGGAFSTIFISEVRDAGRVRSIMRDSVGLAEKLLAAPGLETAMAVELTEEVEKHRGVAIDRYRFTISPPAGEEDPEDFRAAMKAIFGGDDIKVWTAFLDGRIVASYYTSSSDDLKEMIDRMKENRAGSLLESASFREATSGFPEEAMSLSFFSLPRFMGLMIDVAARVKPEEKIPPWPLTGETASGIGISYRSSGGALRVETHIPRQEVENLRSLTDYFESLPKKKKKILPL